MPGDDRFYFVLDTASSIPVLVVEGPSSGRPWESAGEFVALALAPPEGSGVRSPFSVKRTTAASLAATPLPPYAAVVLADVPSLDPAGVERVKIYLEGGGLVLVFPGPHTDVGQWNAAALPLPELTGRQELDRQSRIKIDWAAPANPLTASLPREGMDLVLVESFFELGGEGRGEMLVTMDGGHPFLSVRQAGPGRVYTFAVSAQVDFSNFPLTPVFLPMLHRAIVAHRVEVGNPCARPVPSRLVLDVPPGEHQIIKPAPAPEQPDGWQVLPLTRSPANPQVAEFTGTDRAGIYRRITGRGRPEDASAGTPVAALNVPAQESELERISAEQVRALLPGVSVSVVRSATGETQLTAGGTAEAAAASSFPLALLASLCLVGEVLLAWSIGRPIVTAPVRE
jgi:hypothetical protein